MIQRLIRGSGKHRIFALGGGVVALLACASSPLQEQQPAREPTPNAQPCIEIQGVAFHLAAHDLDLSCADLDHIRGEVERFLNTGPAGLEPDLPPPGSVFQDAMGTVRMGSWILEPGSSEDEPLWLTYRVHTSEALLIRQIIGLQHADGGWSATRATVQTVHAAREP